MKMEKKSIDQSKRLANEHNSSNMLIHIGFHKTGTSWLQDNLFNKDESIFRSISTIGKHFIVDEDQNLLNSFDMNEDVIKNELKKVLSAKPHVKGEISVLSYERLSGSPFGAGYNAAAYANRLKKLFPNAKILIVIREQKSVILSGYFQYLTGGGTLSIKKYLNSYFNGLRPHFSLNHYKYEYLINAYYNLFGQSNVLVIPYEIFNSDKHSFFASLSKFLGMKITIENADRESAINKNHHQFIRYRFRFLNHFIRPTELNNFSILSNSFTGKVSWLILKCLLSIPLNWLDKKEKAKILRIINDHIDGKYAHSNDVTSKLTKIRLTQYGYQSQ